MFRLPFLIILMVLVAATVVTVVSQAIVAMEQGDLEPDGDALQAMIDPDRGAWAQREARADAAGIVAAADDATQADEADVARQDEGGRAIVRVPMDGQDVADLLNIHAWRFDYTLPQGLYTVHVWQERWTRDADEPQVRLLLNQTLSTSRDRIVLRMPTPYAPSLYVRVGPAVARADQAEPLDIPIPARRDVLDRDEIAFGEALHLLTLTHDAAQSTAGGLVDVHREHDVTIYIKARFHRDESGVPFEGPAAR